MAAQRMALGYRTVGHMLNLAGETGVGKTHLALAIAVKNDRVQRRFTGLKERLARFLGAPGSANKFGEIRRNKALLEQAHELGKELATGA